MLQSEGVAKISDLMYQQSKNWFNGQGKMYVYNITSTEQQTREEGFDLAPGELLEDYSQSTGQTVGGPKGLPKINRPNKKC